MTTNPARKLMICVAGLPALLAFSSCAHPAGQQAAPRQARAGVYRDTLDGVASRTDIPPAWNGGLIVFAHGYVRPGEKSPGLGESPWADSLRQVFLRRGFAFAESNYRTPGWAVREALEDLERLRARVARSFGAGGRTYVLGHSMGGLVAVATMERHPTVYSGGLGVCSVPAPALAVFQDPLFDLLVAFDYYFPKVITRGDSTLAQAPATDPAAIAAALGASPERAGFLVRRFQIRPEDLSFVIWFYDEVLRDIQRRSGGHPLDNRDRVYAGFHDDGAFNRGVRRYAADSSAVGYLREFYTPTGRIAAPLLLLHTTYDALIPVAAFNQYATLTSIAGTQHLLVGSYVVADGHCQIGMGQIATAFDRLDRWVRTGQRPAGGEIR